MDRKWPQDGPFTAEGSGLSRKALRLRLRRGQIRRVCTGTYADARTPDTVPLRLAALALVLPSGSVACRSTAAWVHGIDTLPIGSRQREPALEIAVLEGTTAVRRRGIRSYVEQLGPGDVVRIGTTEVTSPLRTAADLGRWLPRYHAIGALDAFLRSGLVSRTELRTATDRWFTYAGVKQLRELVELADPRAESPRESWLRLALHDAGFPAPEPQFAVHRGPGLVPYRLDLALPDLMVAVEYDGAEAHPLTRIVQDEERRTFLRQRGWTVIVVRRGDLERPGRLAEAVGMFVTPVRQPRRGAKAA